MTCLQQLELTIQDQELEQNGLLLCYRIKVQTKAMVKQEETELRPDFLTEIQLSLKCSRANLLKGTTTYGPKNKLQTTFINTLTFLFSEEHFVNTFRQTSDALWVVCYKATETVAVIFSRNVSLLFFPYFLNDNRLGHSEVVSGLHVALEPLFELTEIEIKMFEDVIILRLEFYL